MSYSSLLGSFWYHPVILFCDLGSGGAHGRASGDRPGAETSAQGARADLRRCRRCPEAEPADREAPVRERGLLARPGRLGLRADRDLAARDPRAGRGARDPRQPAHPHPGTGDRRRPAPAVRDLAAAQPHAVRADHARLPADGGGGAQLLHQARPAQGHRAAALQPRAPAGEPALQLAARRPGAAPHQRPAAARVHVDPLPGGARGVHLPRRAHLDRGPRADQAHPAEHGARMHGADRARSLRAPGAQWRGVRAGDAPVGILRLRAVPPRR